MTLDVAQPKVPLIGGAAVPLIGRAPAPPALPAQQGGGVRTVIERPPEGPARGVLPVPATLVVVVALAIVAAVIAHFLYRARRR